MNRIKKAIKFFDGKKTYIVSGFVAIATFAEMVGWITPEQFKALLGFLAAIGVYTVRNAIRKAE